MDNIANKLVEEFKLKPFQVENAIKLIDEGNTIPFIARYRKEATGELSDEQLRDLFERLTYLRNLEKRKEEVIRLIDEQGKLTEELQNTIVSALTMTEVEDLYRPYKQKKKTRATIAKAKGLEPLANIIFEQKDKRDINEIAKEFIDEEKDVKTAEEAINGAKDIIAEMISDVAEFRKDIRKIIYDKGVIATKASKDEKSVYEMYYDYNEAVKKIPSHRILAINRGEKEDFLKVKIEETDDAILDYLNGKNLVPDGSYKEIMLETIEDAYKRLIKPSVENEVRNELTDMAEEQAIKVFGQNAKKLLLQAPLKNLIVMGFDPAYRTGCKIAVIDDTGKLLATTTVYPTEPQNDTEGAKKKLLELINKYNINMIAIGNGTASRESESFIVDVLKSSNSNCKYIIVNEAGASVYSASSLAKSEFPLLDVSQRSAISIGRRLQDPLSELVKIDPKSIGVGLYQHDVKQKELSEALDFTVSSVVNAVGVNANTCSASILSYVSGLNKKSISCILDERDRLGKFNNRNDLKRIKGISDKVYEQAIGFIRINDGDNPLDRTNIHPESYDVVYKLLDVLGLSISDIGKESFNSVLDGFDKSSIDFVDEYTLLDIIDNLKKPLLDPRMSLLNQF